MHLGFVADLLGIPSRKFRGLHRAAGWMVTALATVHAVVKVNQAAYPLHDTGNIFAIIAIACLGALSLFFIPYFRRLSYEVFLRVHQLLALLCAYAIWRHLPSHISSQLYIYIGLGIFLVTCTLQIAIYVYCNGAFTSRGSPRALATYVGPSRVPKGDGRISAGLVKVCVTLPRPLVVRPGQYISLRIPGVSWWSWAQSHPFMVTSWSPERQSTLELLVQPRQGFTADLVLHARTESGVSFSFPALFSGPHGVTEPLTRYETVIVVASGVGVAAVMSYLKQLIHDYNVGTSQTRRVHFVWQLQTPDIMVALLPWLNELLKDDVLDNGYILSISVYLESGDMAADETLFGAHKRAMVHYGPVDIQGVLEAEIAGEHIRQLPNVQEERGELLVMASASSELHDRLRGIVRNHLQDKVRMVELEFQPQAS
ncbi:hypothetical protein LOZ65_004256 [Ophidiomyces ophidiicola]|nr:hypothetical protein LOZ65_004256 [Ophidiomyces ophidiicola]